MKPLGYAERIGGVLAAPRRTLDALAAGEARAGDVAWLLCARLVAGELPRLVRAWLTGRELGAGVGVQSALAVVRDLLPDIVGILIAGVVMGLFVGKQARGYGRTLDLASYAWIPYLTVALGAALFFTARGYPPSDGTQLAVQLVGLAWAIAVWGVALVAARRPA